MQPVLAPIAAPDRIKLLAEGFDVAPLRAAIERHHELWNEHSGRTKSETSPHREASDIWGRFAPAGVSGATPHFSVWYPAADVLPLRDMARELMAMTGGTVLGGVLITRIPPGAQVYPHIDPGWHAEFYSKIAVQVDAHPDQSFNFEGQSLVTKPGDVFSFINQHTHWVTNDSPVNRTTAIFCIRIEPGPQ